MFLVTWMVLWQRLDEVHDRLSFRPLKALEKVIETFAGRKDGWNMAYWFRSSNRFLGSKRPHDLLISAPKRVIEAAIDEIQGVKYPGKAGSVPLVALQYPPSVGDSGRLPEGQCVLDFMKWEFVRTGTFVIVRKVVKIQATHNYLREICQI